MKKYFLFLVVSLFFVFPCHAQEIPTEIPSEEIFKAKVIEILREEEKIDEFGHEFIQQDVLLKGISGPFSDKEVIYKGISEVQLQNEKYYKTGDHVLVLYSPDIEGNPHYYIIDFIRTNGLWYLTLLFIFVVIFIGKKKGVKALVVLGLTFLIILYFMIPFILKGFSPFLITIVGALLIMGLALYVTEGFHMKSHLAFLSILASLCITVILSILFTSITKLSGLSSDEALYLQALGLPLQLEGILLAGIIIGTLGVLDDIVISQISVVIELFKSNHSLSAKEVYKKAMNVGIDHMGAIVNTLFLAYTGASFPLLLLFAVKQAPFLTFFDVVNTELVATEIVRTLIGSIALILTLPIATLLAAYFFASHKDMLLNDHHHEKHIHIH